MSYRKAMKHSMRKSRMQAHMNFGFAPLAKDERRRLPWLGGTWYEQGMEKEREEFIRQYQAETEKLILINPSLKIID